MLFKQVNRMNFIKLDKLQIIRKQTKNKLIDYSAFQNRIVKFLRKIWFLLLIVK